VIEPARIFASGKIKTDFTTVKNNVAFWNDLHHLGLQKIRERSNAANWTIGNSVMAVREVGVDDATFDDKRRVMEQLKIVATVKDRVIASVDGVIEFYTPSSAISADDVCKLRRPIV
jgi:hypothetical protein